MITLPNYQITQQIYESANSLVYRGVQNEDNQAVILKILKEDYPTPEELTRYRMEVAKLLGVSQPAVSLYCRNMRGSSIDLRSDSVIKNLVVKMAESLVKDNLPRKELILKYCEICRAIRAKGLLCDLHKEFDSAIDTEKCGLCNNANSSFTECF